MINFLKPVLLLYIIFMTLSAVAQKTAVDAKPGEVIVKGKIGKINPPMQLWIYMGEEKWDTVVIKDGVFEYRKKTMLPAYGAIMIRYRPFIRGDKRDGNFFTDMSLRSVYFEKGTMTVNSPVDTLANYAVVKGSSLHDKHLNFWNKEGDIIKEQKKLAAVFNAATPEQLQSENYQKQYEQQNELLLKKWDSLMIAEVRKYPNSLHAFLNYLGYLRQRTPKEQIAKEIASMLSPEYQEKSVASLDYYYKPKIEIKTGDISPDFAQNDVLGKPLKLSDLRGKYILLDFWASWCGPCRKVNPSLVKLYEKYKSNQFEILGISLDEDRTKWKEAIKADGLDWLHVSDLKGWKNAVAEQYGISGIPQNFLLDREGRVIQKNLNIDELDKELEKLLNSVSAGSNK